MYIQKIEQIKKKTLKKRTICLALRGVGMNLEEFRDGVGGECNQNILDEILN